VIKAWLTAPIIERDKRGMQQSTEARDSNRGTPQGGIITPPTIWQNCRSSPALSLRARPFGHDTVTDSPARR
jgi:hypothetical protein